MCDKHQYNDETLCTLAASGDRIAEEVLVLRYNRLVRICARPYFLTGGDSEDLIQEAMFGLLKAIREFDPERDASFRTFAEVCIRNRIRSVITAAAGGKHMPLNNSVPMEALPDIVSSPEESLIDREEDSERLRQLKNRLSPLEKSILPLYLAGLTYEEIGHQLGRQSKSVDNAIQRIRHKGRELIPALSAKADANIILPQHGRLSSGPGQVKREGISMYEDKTLVCKECGQEFVFTAGEQEFYAERGFQNEPQRCKACRDARKAAARGPREYFTATCAACGGEAKVPFEPKSDRPVYCSECFAKMREQG